MGKLGPGEGKGLAHRVLAAKLGRESGRTQYQPSETTSSFS